MSTDKLFVLEKWLKVSSHGDKMKYNYILGSLLDKLNVNISEQKEPIYTRFREQLGDMSTFPPEAIAAGIGMYMLMSYLSYRSHGEIINEESIFYICLLYIDLDYFIDTNENPKEYIKSVRNFIYRDLKSKTLIKYDGNDRRFIWYRKIVEKNTNLIEHIYNLFSAEIKSYYIQKKTPLLISGNKILESITREKSRYTAILICAIVNIQDQIIVQSVIEMGYVSQILDDMFDLDEDLRDGIQTLINYNLKKKGNIDKIFIKLIENIGKIDNKYNEIRIGMLYMALYNVTKYKLLSPRLMLKVEPYILFDHRYGINIKLY